MIQEIFTPATRDKAIETTCQNLVTAGGILTPEEAAGFMTELTGYTDVELGIALLESKSLLDNWLVNKWSKS